MSVFSELRQRAEIVRGSGGVLGSVFDDLAAVHGDRRAVEQPTPLALAGGATSLTFREAAAIVATASGLLAGRFGGGRRVVVTGENDYDFFLACMAVARAGGVVVPVNARMRDDEIRFVVADADADVLEVSELVRLLESAEASSGEPPPAAEASPGDVAAIFYTSGTTGHPKGVRHTHKALLGPLSRAVLWPSPIHRDEVVVSLPIAHIMGFAALVGAAFAGVGVYFVPHFRPREVLDAIEARRATVFIGVPTMYRMMLEAGAEERDLRSVRLWAASADVMPADLARRYKRLGATVTLPVLGWSLGEAAFAQGYGMVELAGAATFKVSPPMLSFGLGDLLGVSLPGFRMRIVDDEGLDLPAGEVGELLVRGPGNLQGYHGDEGLTRDVLTDDGWLRTGDLASRNRLGVVRFAGRKKDLIKHGGYSVYPSEVEGALAEHPDVAEAAVVGRPDPVKGEVPVAFVRLEPGATTDADELVAWARERLADYKAPQEIVFVDDLPRTGTGKVSKPELRARLV